MSFKIPFAVATLLLAPILSSTAFAQAAPAAAQAEPTPQQIRYMAARAFDLQIREVRAYCGADAALKARVDGAWNGFRSRNADFVQALANPPREPSFVAATRDFEANEPKMAAMVRERVRANPAANVCPAFAEQLGTMKFSELLAEADRRRKAAPAR